MILVQRPAAHVWGYIVDITTTPGNSLGDMPKTLTEVTRDAAELPASDRLKLARILLDLSEDSTEPAEDLQVAWDDEIARRLSELRTGTVKAVPLAESKKRTEAGFRS